MKLQAIRIVALALAAVLASAAGRLSAEATAPARPSPLIVNPDGRSHVLLDGRWRVIVDPLSAGDASPVAAGVEGAGFYQDRQRVSPLELIEYRFSDKVTLAVPGDWNSQDPRLFFYQAPVWYRQTFDRPAKGARHFLYFGAVNYAADVYLNGRLVARHEGGFTPFTIEVTDRLRAQNLLVVKVDNRLGPETVPTAKTDWFNYGGITRSVRLISTPKAYVRDYVLRLADRDRRLIAVSVEADGARAGDRVRVAIPELGRRLDVPVGADGKGSAQFEAPVELWSPENPRLYDVTLSFGGETIRDRIGFRTIETRGTEVLLNGRPVFLKGIAMHEESILHPGRSAGRADALAMLGLVKELGGNFVRLAHYPHDEATTRAADELGLLVWSEIPVYWSIDWTSERAYTAAAEQLRANILRDRNRASVVIWSVANETPMSEARLAFLRKLVATTRELDPSRLVSAALFGDPFGFFRKYAATLMARIALDPATPEPRRATVTDWFARQPGGAPDAAALKALAGQTVHIVDDPLGDELDIVAYNQYFGWYPAGFLARALPIDEPTLRLAEFGIMPELVIDPRQDKPFIISEFGADARKGVSGDDDLVFSEQFQARYYRLQMEMLANSRKLRGVSPWVLKDFRTFLRTHPDYQEYFNRKGLVDEAGNRKLAFDVLRDVYTGVTPLPQMEAVAKAAAASPGRSPTR